MPAVTRKPVHKLSEGNVKVVHKKGTRPKERPTVLKVHNADPKAIAAIVKRVKDNRKHKK